MEFGGFADDLFEVEEKEETRSNEDDVTGFVPKMDSPLWYLNAPATDVERLRLQAYHFYHSGDFQTALERFSQLHAMSEGSLRPCWMEALESMARCCLQLGQFADAERYGLEFLSASRHYDNSVQGWKLMLDIYTRSDCSSKALEFLVRLLHEFNRNAQLWIQLAKIAEQGQLGDICTSCGQWIRVGSLVRAACLLERTGRTAVGFSQQRNRTSRDGIGAELIKLADVHRGDLDRIRRNVASDILRWDDSEDRGGEVLPTSSTSDVASIHVDVDQFFHQWFAWGDCSAGDCQLSLNSK